MLNIGKSFSSSKSGLGRTVFLRSFFLETLWNYPRMQNIGFTHCIYPALKAFIKKEEKFEEALKRQLESANTHPTMGPMLAGIVTRLETDHKVSNLSLYRRRIMTTLAAQGDHIFWGNIKPLAAAFGVLGLLCFPNSFVGPVLTFLVYNVPNIYIRAFGFDWGYNEGVSALERFKIQKTDKTLVYVRSALSLCLGIITGLVFWQCYQDIYGLYGATSAKLSIFILFVSGLVAFLLIRSGFTLGRVALPVALAAISIFLISKNWIGIW